MKRLMLITLGIIFSCGLSIAGGFGLGSSGGSSGIKNVSVAPVNDGDLLGWDGITGQRVKNITMLPAGTTAITQDQGDDGTRVATTAYADAIFSNLSSTAFTGKVLTNYSSGVGTVSASDTILSAFGKLNGNIEGKQASLTNPAVLGTAQTWTQAQTFSDSGVKLKGSSTGFTTFSSANNGATNYTLTVPAANVVIAANDGSNLAIANQATGDLAVASSTTAYGKVAAVAVGQVLTSQGTGAAPAYSANPTVSNIDCPTITSAAQGDATLNLDGVAYCDYNYSNGASAAAYTTSFTSKPASGLVRYITLSLGGGAGVVTTTWTGVAWIGTAGSTTTTTNKTSSYACKVGNATTYCTIIAEAY